MLNFDVLAGIGGLGMQELLVVLVIVLVLFGGAKLPGLARSLGRSLGEFKKGKDEGEKGLSDSASADKETKSLEKKTPDSEKK